MNLYLLSRKHQLQSFALFYPNFSIDETSILTAVIIITRFTYQEFVICCGWRLQIGKEAFVCHRRNIWAIFWKRKALRLTWCPIKGNGGTCCKSPSWINQPLLRPLHPSFELNRGADFAKLPRGIKNTAQAPTLSFLNCPGPIHELIFKLNLFSN